jgi:hypothetical protein
MNGVGIIPEAPFEPPDEQTRAAILVGMQQGLMALYGRVRTVLVVDDHPLVRDGLRLFLTVTPGMIGSKLFISDATARFHVSNVLAKLGVTNRTEAVRLAIKQGLIE